MSPRLWSLPEQRRRATDSDETLMQQHQRRGLLRRSSASGNGSGGAGGQPAALDKRGSLGWLLSGRGEAAEQLLSRGNSLQQQASVPGQAPVSREASGGAQHREAHAMGSLAQAGLPALPSPPLGEAFAVLEAWLGLARHKPPWDAQRQHWDRCGLLSPG